MINNIDVESYVSFFFTKKENDENKFISVDSLRKAINTYVQETFWNSDFQTNFSALCDALIKHGFSFTVKDGVFLCNVDPREFSNLERINDPLCDMEVKQILIKDPDFIRVVSAEKKKYVELVEDENSNTLIVGDRIMKTFTYKDRVYTLGFEYGFFVIRRSV